MEPTQVEEISCIIFLATTFICIVLFLIGIYVDDKKYTKELKEINKKLEDLKKWLFLKNK